MKKSITAVLLTAALAGGATLSTDVQAQAAFSDYVKTQHQFAHKHKDDADVLVLLASETEDGAIHLPEMWDPQVRSIVQSALALEDFTGKHGQQVELLALPGFYAKRLWVVGTGTAMTRADAEKLGAQVAVQVGEAADTVVVHAKGFSDTQVAAMAHGMDLRNYRFDRYKSEPAERPDYTVHWHSDQSDAAAQAYADTQPLAHGVFVARDIINLPGSDGYPKAIAEIAQTAVSNYDIKATVYTPEQVKEMGMGALYGVSQGSQHKSHLLVVEYQGGGNEAPIALVGKGNTFDTGGYNLKTSGSSIVRMQTDKAGGAAVLGAVMALAGKDAELNVAGVVPLSHNLISGSATLPGDVLHAADGTRIEVVNTDAEGRLILADGIWYARDRLKARAIADIATLTGSKVRALGTDYAAIFSEHDALISTMKAAGESTGELVWQLPLGPYDGIIDSWLADIQNVGSPGAQAGARLLQHFAKDTPWIHIDMAGNAYGTSASGIHPAGGNGYGVRLLSEWVENYNSASPVSAAGTN
ncbi:leucyl aminopeptidase family protein [Pseudidiomarina terrestris]|uniref:leucyl aminopeptidase family protein n=1 Tax=Pseudidiomarina terrestris TaxID=2820060 RepID=UPI00264DB813|nr:MULTISPECIES: leucyl aminopeptidase [unclassified Pseudidiomarina]MDN7126097.1 leucyl aminopeptidase [Pseudidiomarina sp. 1APR75-33.1]MDN7134125.1 leucyl aminopeptidase [Pseudidiomarina sp. 1ASP75-5]MEA3588486.1 leucyl aminopeptidase [Pseudidiomarina sp. 1APP75-27a]